MGGDLRSFEIYAITSQLVNGVNYGVIASALADDNYECKAGVYDGPFSNERPRSATLNGVCCYKRNLKDMVRHC